MLETIKRRTMTVQGADTAERCEALGVLVASLDGVRNVAILDPGTLRVEYDLARVRRRQIEQALVANGFGLADGCLARWKRHWLDQLEANEYDNMTAKAAPCCSNPESIVGVPRRKN